MQPEEQEQSKTNKRIRLYTLSILGTIVIAALLLWLLHWGMNVSRDWNELQNAQAEETPALKSQFDASLEIAKAIVSGIGTAATIAGGIVLYLNFRVANQQAKTATEQARIANRQAELAESRLITDRFSKAVEQLEDKRMAVRLGGIYALEKIAEDAPSLYHWIVVEVLSAFLRHEAPLQANKRATLFAIEADKLPRISDDLQAAITVIGRRNTVNDPEGEWMQLIEQDHSLLMSAFVDSLSTPLSLRSSIPSEFYSSKRLNLSRIDLSRANLNSLVFRGSFLYDVDFSWSVLRNADFSGAILTRADFTGSDAVAAKFKGSDLSNATVFRGKLFRADLHKANCIRANFLWADLCKADLVGTNFWEARLESANLNEANLSKANLICANLTNAQGLTPEQVKSALNWDKAIYDEDLRKQLGLPPDYDAEIRQELGLPPREGQE